MKTFNTKDENILSRLIEIYDLEHLEYNIMTDNFCYEANGEKKRFAIESFLKWFVTDDNFDQELYDEIQKNHASYFNRRIKDVITTIYLDHDFAVPKDIFINNGKIHFPIGDMILPVAYDDDFDKFLTVLDQALLKEQNKK